MRPRGNGLSAASYSPLRDIDPRLTDAALEALRAAGVAAYAVPATNQPVLGFEVVTANRPVDRLYVDTAAVETARRIIDEGFAEDQDSSSGDAFASVRGADGPSAEPDLDAAFEQVIAGFDDVAEDPRPRWPSEEDLAEDREQITPPARLTPPTDSDDDHFVPPTPPPLPKLEPVTKLAWIGVLGGPLILFTTLFGVTLSPELVIIATAAFIGGFITLVVRLKDDPDEADPDDGAVV